MAGVVEGFYGAPWTDAERLELFDWMAGWALDTYVYAPKDDLHHRARWRERYAAADADRVRELTRACADRGLRFVYGLGPGLDIRYGSDADVRCLQSRVEQVLALGCDHVALLFDDVPDSLGEEDLERWGALAPAQCHVANALVGWLRDQRAGARLLFCPTAYCGRMAAAGLGGPGYLEALGRDLQPDIDILWTGPEIVSREITVVHAREMGEILRRRPVIWDNLHANDYDGRRFFCGPYAGRPAALRDEVGGLLSNPNCEFPLNYVPIRTLAAYVHGRGAWDPRGAWVEAMAEWHPRMHTIDGPLPFEDLTVFGDCYYLPHEEGPAARELEDRLADLLGRTPAEWGPEADVLQAAIRRLRACCERLTTLRARPLFHALSRRIWELREELDLLDRFLEAQRGGDGTPVRVRSDAHQPGTYRGGLVAALQRLVVQCPDGAFVSAAARRDENRPGGMSGSAGTR